MAMLPSFCPTPSTHCHQKNLLIIRMTCPYSSFSLWVICWWKPSFSEMWLHLLGGTLSYTPQRRESYEYRIHPQEASRIHCPASSSEQQRSQAAATAGSLQSALSLKNKFTKWLQHPAFIYSPWRYTALDSRCICSIFAPSIFLFALEKDLTKQLTLIFLIPSNGQICQFPKSLCLHWSQPF